MSLGNNTMDSTPYSSNSNLSNVLSFRSLAGPRSSFIYFSFVLNIAGICFVVANKSLKRFLKMGLLNLLVCELVFATTTLLFGPLVLDRQRRVSNVLCVTFCTFIVGTVAVSYTSVLGLALYNYIAVLMPSRFLQLVTTRRIGLAIAACWMLLLTASFLGQVVPAALQESTTTSCYVLASLPRATLILLAFYCFICCVGVCGLNLWVCLKIRSTRRVLATNSRAAPDQILPKVTMQASGDTNNQDNFMKTQGTSSDTHTQTQPRAIPRASRAAARDIALYTISSSRQRNSLHDTFLNNRCSDNPIVISTSSGRWRRTLEPRDDVTKVFNLLELRTASHGPKKLMHGQKSKTQISPSDTSHKNPHQIMTSNISVKGKYLPTIEETEDDEVHNFKDETPDSESHNVNPVKSLVLTDALQEDENKSNAVSQWYSPHSPIHSGSSNIVLNKQLPARDKEESEETNFCRPSHTEEDLSQHIHLSSEAQTSVFARATLIRSSTILDLRDFQSVMSTSTDSPFTNNPIEARPSHPDSYTPSHSSSTHESGEPHITTSTKSKPSNTSTTGPSDRPRLSHSAIHTLTSSLATLMPSRARPRPRPRPAHPSRIALLPRERHMVITLVILAVWNVLVTLPPEVMWLWAAVAMDDRAAFAETWLCKLMSSALLVSTFSNPLLYIWRLVNWRNIYNRCRSLLFKSTT